MTETERRALVRALMRECNYCKGSTRHDRMAGSAECACCYNARMARAGLIASVHVPHTCKGN